MVEWVILIYDKPGVSRAPHREAHLSNIRSLTEQGIMKVAGAIYKDVINSQVADPIGSHIVIDVPTKQDAVLIVSNDPFAQGNVWDMDSLIIYPTKHLVLEL